MVPLITHTLLHPQSHSYAWMFTKFLIKILSCGKSWKDCCLLTSNARTGMKLHDVIWYPSTKQAVVANTCIKYAQSRNNFIHLNLPFLKSERSFLKFYLPHVATSKNGYLKWLKEYSCLSQTVSRPQEEFKMISHHRDNSEMHRREEFATAKH